MGGGDLRKSLKRLLRDPIIKKKKKKKQKNMIHEDLEICLI